VPIADSRLFDHLVGACEERGRHREAECLGCFEIDHQLVLSGRLHRQVGWLLALEDAIDIACRALELVGNWLSVRSIQNWRTSGVIG
jgi:hypothetical protein